MNILVSFVGFLTPVMGSFKSIQAWNVLFDKRQQPALNHWFYFNSAKYPKSLCIPEDSHTLVTLTNLSFHLYFNQPVCLIKSHQVMTSLKQIRDRLSQIRLPTIIHPQFVILLFLHSGQDKPSHALSHRGLNWDVNHIPHSQQVWSYIMLS